MHIWSQKPHMFCNYSSWFCVWTMRRPRSVRYQEFHGWLWGGTSALLKASAEMFGRSTFSRILLLHHSLGKVMFPTSGASICGAVWEFTLTWPLHRISTSDYYAAHSLTPFWSLVRSSRNSQSGSDLQNMCVTKPNSQNSVLGISVVCLNLLCLNWTCLSSYDLPILEVGSKPCSFHVILSRPGSFSSKSLTFIKRLFSLNRLTGFS